MNYFRIFLSVAVLLFTKVADAEDLLTVQVKETQLRSAPRQWAPKVSSLKYGDSVTPLKIENDWVEGVAKSKQKGFVHISALSSKKVVLASTKLSSSVVDPTDVILAGKGFSQATEAEYLKQNTASNFKAVDSVQALQLSDSELLTFMRDGRIGEGVK